MFDRKQYNREWLRNYVRKNKAEGLCIKCGCTVMPMRVRCKPCILKQRIEAIKRMRKLRIKRAETGHCTICGIKKHPDMDRGYKTCLNCREWRNFCKSF